MTWGSSLWGDSDVLPQDVGKLVTDTLASDSAIPYKDLEFIIANTLTFSCETTAEYLTNGIWSTVFQGDVTNANDRISTTYASGGAGSGSYTNGTPPTTVWS
jgi:hypothetical protein